MSQPLLDGRYRVLNEIGRGGMATVYLGIDLTTDRQVAIKVLLGALSPTRYERFLREGQTLGGLSHPGIVAIHNAGEYQGRPYLVMELVRGARELGEAWTGHTLEQRVTWLIEVANALGAAHAAGVVHRDVKPSNVLIDHEGRARLTDFGVAVAEEQERLTRTGALVGTPHWMAPELFKGANSASPRSDVWSLGVLLYEAMTDRLPFDGDTIHKLMGNLANGYVTPRTLSREIPRDLETVCVCALDPEPTGRYKTATDFADDLARFLRGEPVEARRRWRGVRKGHGLVVGAALAGLLATGALAWALTRGGPPASDTPQPPVAVTPAGQRQNSVAQLNARAVRGQTLPTLEALQPWAIQTQEDAIRLRFNGKTSPELRLPCRYDAATAFTLRTRVRVPLLIPSNRVCLAFQRWERDAPPVEVEAELRDVNDYLRGADNLEREAIYVELVCVGDGTFFGSYELRAGTEDAVLWQHPLPRALGPERELELELRVDPKTGVQVAAKLEGRDVGTGEFELPRAGKGEWLLRVGANLVYTPTTRYGVWQAGGEAAAPGRVDVLQVELEAAGRGGVRILESIEDDPRHELGRLGRDLLRPEPDFATFDERSQVLGRIDQEFTREELWIANTARYLHNLSLATRGLEAEARDEWQRDFVSYYAQGAGPRSGKLGWLGWRWAHDMGCYDAITRRAVAEAFVRVWQVESPSQYTERLITRKGAGTWEGAALAKFPNRAEFEVRRGALALALTELPEVNAPNVLLGEVAFGVGAFELLNELRWTPEDYQTVPPRVVAGLRLGAAVAAVCANDLERAQRELALVPKHGETPRIVAARDWLNRLTVEQTKRKN